MTDERAPGVLTPGRPDGAPMVQFALAVALTPADTLPAGAEALTPGADGATLTLTVPAGARAATIGV